MDRRFPAQFPGIPFQPKYFRGLSWSRIVSNVKEIDTELKICWAK